MSGWLDSDRFLWWLAGIGITLIALGVAGWVCTRNQPSGDLYDPLEAKGIHTVTPHNIDTLLDAAAQAGVEDSGRGEPAVLPRLAPPPAPIDTTTQEHQ